MEPERSDWDALSELVAGCQLGDRSSQQQLYEACYGRVFRLAARMVGLQEAADVTQQVFLQAFRSIEQFKGRSRFRTWLHRLAVNESLQHLRRGRRWRYHSLDREPMDESHPRENAERKELLAKALAKVDPELRSIFLLRELEGMSYQEIAEAMRIPEGTVGSRLNRARRELQKHLVDLEPDLNS